MVERETEWTKGTGVERQREGLGGRVKHLRVQEETRHPRRGPTEDVKEVDGVTVPVKERDFRDFGVRMAFERHGASTLVDEEVPRDPTINISI